MSVTIGLVIDTSASMKAQGYVADTVIDSKAFVNTALQPGDQFTVVQYSTGGANVYPASGTALATVDSQRTVPTAAATAIQNLNFNGSCTNITNTNGGIPFAASFVNSATANQGLVLLTDGYQNCGTNPPALPSYPVYVCGMGANVNTSFLKNIATTTGGTYYAMPYVSTMMQIYNNIRGTSTTFPSVQLLDNTLNPLQPLNYIYQSVSVDDTSDIAEFAVTWDNTSYTYTSSSQPTGNQISITLVDPSGNVISTPPVVIGSGYVVFDVSSPATGMWYTQVEYAGTSSSPTINFTIGVFEFAADDAVTLEVESAAVSGGSTTLRARAMQHGKPLPGVVVHAETLVPTISEKDALAQNRDALASLETPADGKLSDSQRLNILHQKLLPERDIFAHRRGILHFAPQQDGSHTASVVPRTNVMIKAVGKTDSGVAFQRTTLVSV